MEANSATMTFNAYSLQLEIYKLCGQTIHVPTDCVLNTGCKIQYINQQMNSTSSIQTFVSQKLRSILLVWNSEVTPDW